MIIIHRRPLSAADLVEAIATASSERARDIFGEYRERADQLLVREVAAALRGTVQFPFGVQIPRTWRAL